MSGGARITNTPVSPSNNLTGSKSVSTASTSFQDTLGKAVSNDPKASFTTLSKVLQTHEVSHGQRMDAFRQIAQRIISNPSHPYSHIEAEVRSDMIDSVASAMADSHLKLPARIG